MTGLPNHLDLLLENLLFLAIATTFFLYIGWVWREAKPFDIPQPLPGWFKGWLAIVLVVGIGLPIAAILVWGMWWGQAIVFTVLLPYLLMLGLQILSESVVLNRFHSCIWVTIPCMYLPYRVWQLYQGLMLLDESELTSQLIWVKILLKVEIVLWIFNYGVHLSQLPRLLQWQQQSSPPSR